MPLLGRMRREGGKGWWGKVLPRGMVGGGWGTQVTQVVRGGLHVGLWVGVMKVFFFWAAYSNYVNWERGDGRLEEVSRAAAMGVRREREERRREREREREGVLREARDRRGEAGEMGQGRREDRGLWGRGGRRVEGEEERGVDGGGYEMDDGVARTQSTSKGFENRPRWKPQAKDPEPQDFDFDDASPTGGAGATDPGSAWDRIRQDAVSGSSSSSSSSSGPGAPSSSKSNRPAGREGGWQGGERGQREGSSEGDPFSFSSEERERGLAKEQSQREFDARVEKERRGGEFGDGDGSGGGGRW